MFSYGMQKKRKREREEFEYLQVRREGKFAIRITSRRKVDRKEEK